MSGDREEWLAWRRQGIGASDVPGILGLSSFASPWSVWATKCLTIPDSPMGERQQIGLDLEAAIATMFHRRTGLYVAGEQTWCASKVEPWARCTVDGFVFEAPEWPELGSTDVEDALGNFQAKTDGRFGWPDGIPPSIQAQCQYEMFVTGAERTWVATLHAGFKFEVYELERDEAEIAFIVARVRDFWTEHVLTGNPPPTDASEATADALALAYPGGGDPDTVTPLDDLEEIIDKRAQLKALIRDAQKCVDGYDNEIRAAMADDEIGTVKGVPVLTLRTVTVNRKPQPASTTTYRRLAAATKKDRENA